MIIFTDGCHFDDIWALNYLLKTSIYIECIVITGNGWSDAAASLSVITYWIKWYGRDIPIIVGSLYAIKDYKENFEIEGFPQGEMFGRTIPKENRFDASYLYSYISWLPPHEIEQKAYKNDYKEKIFNIVNELDKVEILSLGAMTDIAYLVEELDMKDQLNKIEKIFHLGGGSCSGGPVFSVDRSKWASYNNYLDPDAVKIVLEKVGEKTFWIPGRISGSIQFTYHQIKETVLNHPTPDNILLYYMARARLAEGTDIPEGQIPDALLLWDVVAAILFLDPSLGTIEKQYLNTIVDSCVCVKDMYGEMDCYGEKSEYTCVTYSYNNELAEMFEDCCYGYKTNVFIDINKEKIEENFYELLAQSENGPLCDLRKPLGCYKFEIVDHIEP